MEKEHYYIWVQTQVYKKKVEIDTILFCQAVNRKVDIYLHPEGKVLGTLTLTEMETLLPSDQFYRCNRQCIINVEHVDQYSEKIPEVILTNGTRILVAKDRKEVISRLLKVN